MDEYGTKRVDMDLGGVHLPRRRSVREYDDLHLRSDVGSFAAHGKAAREEELENAIGASRSMDHLLHRKHRVPDPNDFSDVFGGPPRTLFARSNLMRNFDFVYPFSSSSCSSPDRNFYGEVFTIPDDVEKKVVGAGRSLLAFTIPAARKDEFYDDVFGLSSSEEIWQTMKERSRSNSKPVPKSKCFSVRSSEEISPSGPPLSCDDASQSSFVSKLRPIIIDPVWNSAIPMKEEQTKKKEKSCLPYDPSFPTAYHEVDHEVDDFTRSFLKTSRHISSPETISLEPTSHPSNKASADETDLNTPVSSASHLCQNGMPSHPVHKDECEPSSSYVIEINSDRREGTDTAVSIEEAIAWAKEKFQSHSTKDNSSDVEESPEEEFIVDEKEKLQSVSIEMQLLDEDIRSWSAGKESNIRLLLSTLHLILWPSSGWYPIPLPCLKETSQVKKAYQRARLCLHPDKLQQRGVTFPQTYVAERAFPILQEAWTRYISRDALFS